MEITTKECTAIVKSRGSGNHVQIWAIIRPSSKNLLKKLSTQVKITGKQVLSISTSPTNSSTVSQDGTNNNNTESHNIVYTRNEDVIMHSLIYEVLPPVFNQKPPDDGRSVAVNNQLFNGDKPSDDDDVNKETMMLYEVVTLKLVDDGEGNKTMGAVLSPNEEPEQGMFVESVEEGSPNKEALFPGDTILEIENQTITSAHTFKIFFKDGSKLLVQRGA